MRERFLELRASLLRGDDHQRGPALLANLAVKRLRDVFQVVVHELLDVTLVARLRPAALVVTSRLVLEMLRDLFQAAGAKAIDITALAADDGDEGTLAPADQRNERRQVEAPPDLDHVWHALAQCQRPPEIVEIRREDREAVGALPVELVLEEGAETLDVFSHTLLLLMREVRTPGRLGALDLVDQRVHAGRGVARRRGHARIEVEIQADRTPVLRPEPRKLAEAVPRDCRGHAKGPFAGRRRFYACVPTPVQASSSCGRDNLSRPTALAFR